MIAVILNVWGLATFSASKWLGSNLVLWGIVAACYAAAKSDHARLAVEIILAIFETALIPSLIGMLSQWYNTSRHCVRIAFCWCGMIAGQRIGSFIFSYIGNGSGWDIVHICFGIVTVILGVTITLCVPTEPQTALFLQPVEKQAVNQDLSNATSSARRSSFTEIHPIYDVYCWGFIALACLVGIARDPYYLVSGMAASSSNLAVAQVSVILLSAVVLTCHGIAITGNDWAWVTLLSFVGLITNTIAIALRRASDDSHLEVNLVFLYMATISFASMPVILNWASVRISGRVKRPLVFSLIGALFNVKDVVCIWGSSGDSSLSLAVFVAAAVISVCLHVFFEPKRRNRGSL